jgi:signal transduction histidine kinase
MLQATRFATLSVPLLLLLLPFPPTDLPHFSQISAILQNADFTRSSLQSFRSTLLSLKSTASLPPQLDGKLLEDLEEDIEALDSITECGLAQERIANDILGLAQIQLSKYSITPVEFDLATSLRNICRMFKVRSLSSYLLRLPKLTFPPLFSFLPFPQSECRSKGIELKLVIGSSLARLGARARVFADPGALPFLFPHSFSSLSLLPSVSARHPLPVKSGPYSLILTFPLRPFTARLTQVLVNLLSNAIRFTAKSAVREVTLAVEVSGQPPERDTPLIPPPETETKIDEQKPVYLFFSVEDTGASFQSFLRSRSSLHRADCA